MTDDRLLNALNDCVDRLHDGQGIDVCLRAYPAMAPELRPMLEALKLTQRALPDRGEIASAQTRGRTRLLAAMDAIPASERRFRRKSSPLRWLVNMAAALIVVMLVSSLGAVIAAQSSLPGDALYGAKRFSEGVRLSISADNASLQAEFDNRRIDEAQQLMELRRIEEVEFGGTWEIVDDTTWIVAGLIVQIGRESIIAADVREYSDVIVRAMTTDDGGLVVLEILPDKQDGTLLPEPIDTPESTATAIPTPTATETPTGTPIPTDTPIPVPTATPTSTPGSVTPACVPQRPDGWVVYTIEAGDTLSGIAEESDITLQLLMQVNCLVDPNAVIAGQRLFVPTDSDDEDEEPDEHDDDDDGEEHNDDDEEESED